ncbi:accessory factor UbiK family protein [Methylobacillus gramineus]|uniref:accessory factor UbiK family protein n=1 Tax=Methylobacillus gramineus TaxID=755169 RepID=UPI001CFF8823|nr:accessory factor UbiK family protein [Methylobacillus gramineus]MCB5185950.1 accessory factor UbiK family protein [Methylobacillus gramineus]
MDSVFFDDLSKKIKEMYSSVPAGGVERNLNALLQGAFTKLELVSREEFDVQTEVLRRTREKLQQLEKQVAELEGRVGSKA